MSSLLVMAMRQLCLYLKLPAALYLEGFQDVFDDFAGGCCCESHDWHTWTHLCLQRKACLMLPHKAMMTEEALLLHISGLDAVPRRSLGVACKAWFRKCTDNDMTPRHKKACCSGFFVLG